MARIDITLAGRSYPIACDDGQEERVLEIARYIESRMTEIRGSFASVGDNHLLVMVTLLVVDELFDARDELALWSGAAQDQADGSPNGSLAEEMVARLTNRVEALAARLEQR